MPRQNFGVCLPCRGKQLISNTGDGEMEFLPAALEDRFISGVADQRVLELIGRVRRDART
jgi:hypothetical protein